MAARPRRVKNYMLEQHFHGPGAREKQSQGYPASASGPKSSRPGGPTSRPAHGGGKDHRDRESRRIAMPRLKRIVETALYVDDLERARAFYEDQLGLEPL